MYNFFKISKDYYNILRISWYLSLMISAKLIEKLKSYISFKLLKFKISIYTPIFNIELCFLLDFYLNKKQRAEIKIDGRIIVRKFWKYKEMSKLLIHCANFYYKPESCFGIFLASVLYASFMCSGILPTIPDDHIFKKIYDFNFDSSGLPETDLLRSRWSRDIRFIFRI